MCRQFRVKWRNFVQIGERQFIVAASQLKRKVHSIQPIPSKGIGTFRRTVDSCGTALVNFVQTYRGATLVLHVNCHQHVLYK